MRRRSSGGAPADACALSRTRGGAAERRAEPHDAAYVGQLALVSLQEFQLSYGCDVVGQKGLITAVRSSPKIAIKGHKCELSQRFRCLEASAPRLLAKNGQRSRYLVGASPGIHLSACFNAYLFCRVTMTINPGIGCPLDRTQTVAFTANAAAAANIEAGWFQNELRNL